MNWSKAVIAGLVGGVALWFSNFILHGLVMGGTYQKYEVFRMDSGPMYFLAISVLMAVFAALLFAKTRGSWAAGLTGGATFGFFLGLFTFFAHFYNPLTIDGFPYYLSWCWGGIGLIALTIMGAAIGLVYKEA